MRAVVSDMGSADGCKRLCCALQSRTPCIDTLREYSVLPLHPNTATHFSAMPIPSVPPAVSLSSTGTSPPRALLLAVAATQVPPMTRTAALRSAHAAPAPKAPTQRRYRWATGGQRLLRRLPGGLLR